MYKIRDANALFDLIQNTGVVRSTNITQIQSPFSPDNIFLRIYTTGTPYTAFDGTVYTRNFIYGGDQVVFTGTGTILDGFAWPVLPGQGCGSSANMPVGYVSAQNNAFAFNILFGNAGPINIAGFNAAPAGSGSVQHGPITEDMPYDNFCASCTEIFDIHSDVHLTFIAQFSFDTFTLPQSFDDLANAIFNNETQLFATKNSLIPEPTGSCGYTGRSDAFNSFGSTSRTLFTSDLDSLIDDYNIVFNNYLIDTGSHNNTSLYWRLKGTPNDNQNIGPLFVNFADSVNYPYPPFGFEFARGGLYGTTIPAGNILSNPWQPFDPVGDGSSQTSLFYGSIQDLPWLSLGGKKIGYICIKTEEPFDIGAYMYNPVFAFNNNSKSQIQDVFAQIFNYLVAQQQIDSLIIDNRVNEGGDIGIPRIFHSFIGGNRLAAITRVATEANMAYSDVTSFNDMANFQI